MYGDCLINLKVYQRLAIRSQFLMFFFFSHPVSAAFSYLEGQRSVTIVCQT